MMGFVINNTIKIAHLFYTVNVIMKIDGWFMKFVSLDWVAYAIILGIVVSSQYFGGDLTGFFVILV